MQQPFVCFYCFASCLSSHAAMSAKTSSLLVSTSSSWRAPDGAAHALALLAHRVGIAGEEEQRQNDRAVMDAYGFVKGTEARNSESACVAERMKLYQKLTETK